MTQNGEIVPARNEGIIGVLPVEPEPHRCNKPYLHGRNSTPTTAKGGSIIEGSAWRCPDCGSIYIAHRGGTEHVGRFSFDRLQWLPATRSERRQLATLDPSVIPPGDTEFATAGAGTFREPGRLRRWLRRALNGG